MFTKKLFNTLIASILLFSLGFVACQDDDVVYVSMAKGDVAMYPKDTCQLEVKVQGAEAGEVVWEVMSQELADETLEGEVIKLSETGEAVAVNYGIAKVKATIAGGRYAIGTVSVIERIGPHGGEFKIIQDEYYVDPGVFADTIEFSIDPELLKLYPMEVNSSNEELLTIDKVDNMVSPKDGVYRMAIYPKNKQSDEPVEITATLGALETSCKVYTNLKFYLSLEPITSLGGEVGTIELKSYKYEINNENKGRDTLKVYYLASPNDEATLNNIKFDLTASGEGLVINKKGFSETEPNVYEIVLTTGGLPGLASIELKAAGSRVLASCEVYDKNDYEVESVTMLEKEVEICDITYHDLFDQVEVAPFGITDYWPIVWFSENEEIATVDQNGRVVFTAPGKVNVFAQARDKKDNCHFNVLLKVEKSTFASGTPKNLLVDEEAEFKLDITSNLKNIPSKYISWETSNESIATVEPINDGEYATLAAKVKGMASGSVTIKATIKDDKGNTVVAQQNVEVASASDVNIHDIEMNAGYVFLVQGSNQLDVYNADELEQENLKNYVTFNFDQNFSINENKTYNVGSDLTGKVVYNGVDFQGEPAEVDLLNGTITVENGVLTFNIKVGLKGGSQATISGTATNAE